ncbi:MAG: radical SAM protein [Ruminococcus sp.]|nr:radical SAM protein [Ruminococcus sp.]
MPHSNISIFVPHIGCPHRCSFCDQNTISGAQHAPTGDEVRQICEKALSEVRSPEETEIAFFGGSFTAIPRPYMEELLSAAREFVGQGKFRGIRCSTRPDCIDREILELLKSCGVTAIELGAQSMSDKVLLANDRGHTARDVEEASALIRELGFELGLQMMIGLYQSTGDDEWLTFEKIMAIRPDTVRIYPVVILKGTRLARLCESGQYQLFGGAAGMRSGFGFEDVVETAAYFLREFEENGIRVIKCGLHASEFVEQDMVGGFYHPAFRELCESSIYRQLIEEELGLKGEHTNAAGALKELESMKGSVTVAVAPSCISKAIGHKRSNHEYFKEQGIELRIVGDESLPKYKAKLRR